MILLGDPWTQLAILIMAYAYKSGFASECKQFFPIIHRDTLRRFPFDHDLLHISKPIEVAHKAVLHAEFVHHFGDFDIKAAVFGNFHDLTLLPPLDGINAISGLA